VKRLRFCVVYHLNNVTHNWMQIFWQSFGDERFVNHTMHNHHVWTFWAHLRNIFFPCVDVRLSGQTLTWLFHCNHKKCFYSIQIYPLVVVSILCKTSICLQILLFHQLIVRNKLNLFGTTVSVKSIIFRAHTKDNWSSVWKCWYTCSFTSDHDSSNLREIASFDDFLFGKSVRIIVSTIMATAGATTDFAS